ncbi:uncharacterized protein RHOBADRAFT_31704 [Rhodotorula graminis WP1]|uniref:Vacuolar sorting protein VPS24 n=1 Tax=Rhodotorula graminis (strain WP1) TaxID=578459 RepID=A0A194S7C8_RHOGW|nr:uncharacterized protein RHOBADRAFT_31704 [Rhodotorula graminis WP1]KPV75321.1 hypothetical protein RHOBADRAFT_31704 [Rhodotorula graminis WP1]
MQSVSRFLWGPTPQEKVRKWQQQLKKEQRALDREIHALDSAATKVKGDVKRLAQKGDTKNAKLLAREVVRSNRQKQRMLTSKAQLNSINMQLGHQLAMVKVTGTLQASTDIMKASNALVQLPQLAGTMREMSAEMMKELEDEAQEEVDKVLWQITDGKLGQASAASGNKVGALPQQHAAGPTPDEIERDEEMERAIQGLLSS